VSGPNLFGFHIKGDKEPKGKSSNEKRKEKREREKKEKKEIYIKKRGRDGFIFPCMRVCKNNNKVISACEKKIIRNTTHRSHRMCSDMESFVYLFLLTFFFPSIPRGTWKKIDIFKRYAILFLQSPPYG